MSHYLKVIGRHQRHSCCYDNIAIFMRRVGNRRFIHLYLVILGSDIEFYKLNMLGLVEWSNPRGWRTHNEIFEVY